MSCDLVNWLTELRQQIEKTNPQFGGLNFVGWPIPFFGDIRKAKVLTVGVNPSNSEFRSAERWGEIKTDNQWIQRLLNYFHEPEVASHEWFIPWEASLNLIGCSYDNRTAAHLDLSPRATESMRKALRIRFCDMVSKDIRWFFDCLGFCPDAKLILTAGSMILPNDNEHELVSSYLANCAAKHSFTNNRNSRGTFLCSVDGRVRLPVKSFPCGPSADDKFKLIKDVFNCRKALKEFLQ